MNSYFIYNVTQDKWLCNDRKWRGEDDYLWHIPPARYLLPDNHYYPILANILNYDCEDMVICASCASVFGFEPDFTDVLKVDCDKLRELRVRVS